MDAIVDQLILGRFLADPGRLLAESGRSWQTSAPKTVKNEAKSMKNRLKMDPEVEPEFGTPKSEGPVYFLGAFWRHGGDLSCLRQFSAPGRGATDAQKFGCNRFARLLV